MKRVASDVDLHSHKVKNPRLVEFAGMTTTDSDAIESPRAGSMIYNTTDGEFQFYNGTTWLAWVQTAGDVMTGALTLVAGQKIIFDGG